MAGCTSVHAPRPDTTHSQSPTVALCQVLNGQDMLSVTLMFGLSRPNAPNVTQAEWDAFLHNTVTPRFPSGLSVLEASGQWQDRENGRVIQEPSRIVQVITPFTLGLANSLNTIRNTYAKRFQQQSVGLVIKPVCASF
ncbi:DUF3574 domain-containing protein [Acetobacter cibinongensis]|uniref:DUF3574 domain-containing protein n=1 Tax=Acetobacter cibinongensis TaxID=146475 RepID=UPI0013FDBA11|nr:DUF3574 domain-containing protein [Acetobacter cibinongensis]